ncbi:MAG: HlyD family efflux transporter periplasmic adaptor subunit [Chloroflexi bacterium]|nr:HlyD family efflux transporter periplasmic adaptor subunit [Chloroflexota bacterium]MCH8877266.1 HlyD family efflux transporter periplasmic adaptor subunit [Chloroflexota bacterium]MCI0806256.1 HlyD family efflux transporter periplasmic adaptor subunit [Chloroflexota bacterium]MCI0826905.1 HlyD family efflux transporter periplasmic adaptor subunit [Chloroflexota bacterium]MCI0853805.1 HlyD family efflux transporter periplasmic adaptor subunit [Chloroflexota bacterium]
MTHIRKSKWIGLGILAVALAACGSNGNPTEEGAIPIVVDDFSVIADGRLNPIESAQLSFNTGGEIGAVLVAEGDSVEKGQPLVRLANREQFEAAVAAAGLERIGAQQALDALYENAGSMAAQAKAELANARDDLDDTERKWRNQQEGQRASSTTVRAAEAELALAKEAMEAAERQGNKFSSDDAEHAQDYKNFAAAVQRYRLALSSLNWYTGYPTEIDQAVIDAEVALAQAREADAERGWEDLKDGPDPDDVALAEARLANAEAQLAAAEAALTNVELRAPFAGTVAGVMTKVGETAAPGQPAVVLANFSSWIVETDNLTEIELPQIEIGQSVVVAFDALSDVELKGTVTAIRPLFEILQGDVTYVVKIALDGDDPRLQWGMTAVVTFG